MSKLTAVQRNGPGKLIRDGLIFRGTWTNDFMNDNFSVFPDGEAPSVGQKRSAAVAELNFHTDQVIFPRNS